MPQTEFLTPLISIVQSCIQVGKCYHYVSSVPTNRAYAGPFSIDTNHSSVYFPSYQVLSMIHIHHSHLYSKYFWSSVLNTAYAFKPSGNVTLLLSAHSGPHYENRLSQVSVKPNHIHSDERQSKGLLFDEGTRNKMWCLFNQLDLSRNVEGQMGEFMLSRNREDRRGDNPKSESILGKKQLRHKA